MSLTLEVSLISGKTLSLQTDEDESVEIAEAACADSLGSWQRSTAGLHWKRA